MPYHCEHLARYILAFAPLVRAISLRCSIIYIFTSAIATPPQGLDVGDAVPCCLSALILSVKARLCRLPCPSSDPELISPHYCTALDPCGSIWPCFTDCSVHDLPVHSYILLLHCFTASSLYTLPASATRREMVSNSNPTCILSSTVRLDQLHS